MRVLVTGHRGYIGSVVATVLQHAGCEVAGLDSNLYGDCDFGRVRHGIPRFDIDLRDVEFADLLSFDAVIHLAALSDDASGRLDPDLTRAINDSATTHLARCCKEAGVGRLVLASTCGVYGRRNTRLLDESAMTAPLTEYTRSKLLSERELLSLGDDAFAPTVLRLGTVYGVSPRLRLDTVVNELVGLAWVKGHVTLKTLGSVWRPFVHIEDVARVMLAVLTAPVDAVGNQVFNVVPQGENHRIIDVAQTIVDHVPDCSLGHAPNAPDQSGYHVDGSKLLRALPRWSYRWTLGAGIRQLLAAMQSVGLSAGEWRSDRYRRAQRLQSLWEHGVLAADLRSLHTAAA